MKNSSGKGSCWIAYIIIVIVILLAMGSCSGGSSSKNTPWGELGVSKKEYERVYNRYKYGTFIDGSKASIHINLR